MSLFDNVKDLVGEGLLSTGPTQSSFQYKIVILTSESVNKNIDGYIWLQYHNLNCLHSILTQSKDSSNFIEDSSGD